MMSIIINYPINYPGFNWKWKFYCAMHNLDVTHVPESMVDFINWIHVMNIQYENETGNDCTDKRMISWALKLVFQQFPVDNLQKLEKVLELRPEDLPAFLDEYDIDQIQLMYQGIAFDHETVLKLRPYLRQRINKMLGK